MTTWKEIPKERFYEMLGVVPPVVQSRIGFLMGEPMTHRTCTVTGKIAATYSAFADQGSRFFEAEEPMTRNEFAMADAP